MFGVPYPGDFEGSVKVAEFKASTLWGHSHNQDDVKMLAQSPGFTGLLGAAVLQACRVGVFGSLSGIQPIFKVHVLEV